MGQPPRTVGLWAQPCPRRTVKFAFYAAVLSRVSPLLRGTGSGSGKGAASAKGKKGKSP